MSNNIKEFVNAAANISDIMRELSFSGSKKDEYCSFKLVDGETGAEKDYELCFSGNPKADHPKAERAMRASNAVMDLFSKIENSYNCFAVAMASIEPPRPDELRADIRLDGRFKIEPAIEAAESDGAFTGATTHMLEVIIDVFLGNEDTRTVVDTVYVEYSGDRELTFKSASGKQFDTMTREEFKSFFKPREEDAKSKAKDILDDLRKNVGETYNKILTALSEDKESRFSKFFEELKAKRARPDYNASEPLDPHARNIGRIEMRYNTLFLGAERFKAFVYKIKDGADSFDFRLEWGRQRNSDEARKLYYLEDEATGEFVGLTTEAPKDKSASAARSLEFKSDESIVCGLVPRTERGVYVLKKAVFPNKKYKRYFCDRCGTGYFSNDKDNQAYRGQFPLIDSENITDCGCAVCSVEGRETSTPSNGKRFRYISSIRSFDGEKRGAAFAEIDHNGKYVKDGNVFTCSHCNSDFYIGDLKKKLTCDICGSLVCKSCRVEMTAKNTAFDCLIGASNNNKLVFCNGCKKASSLSYKSKNCKIYEAFYDGDEKKKVNVLALVGLSMTKLLEKCADCKGLIYLSGTNVSVTKRCERCGMYFGSGCADKARATGRGPLLICKACHNEMAKAPALEKEFYSTVFNSEISGINADKMRKIKELNFRQLLGAACMKVFKSYMSAKDRRACAQNEYSLTLSGDPVITEKPYNLNGDITASSYAAELAKYKNAASTYDVEFIVDLTVKSTDTVYRFIIKAEIPVDDRGAGKLDNPKIIFGGARPL